MENLNAEPIKNEIQSLIKALKDCGGWVKRGNGEGWFNHEILANALALINSQEQRIKELGEENERLRAQNATLEIYNKDYEYRNKEFLEANEALAMKVEELEIEGDELRERIANLKAVGYWYIREYEFFTCSECGHDYYNGCDYTAQAKERLVNGEYPNFCPNCGAKMKGE